MKKKLLALTMAAAMTAALLAGCGGTPAPSSTGKSDPVSSTAAVSYTHLTLPTKLEV